jgi:hypothetical protein
MEEIRMKKLLIIVFGLLLTFGFCYASVDISDNYVQKASYQYKHEGITVYQQIAAREGACYYMLKAIYEEEKEQTKYLLQLNNRIK